MLALSGTPALCLSVHLCASVVKKMKAFGVRVASPQPEIALCALSHSS